MNTQSRLLAHCIRLCRHQAARSEGSANVSRVFFSPPPDSASLKVTTHHNPGSGETPARTSETGRTTIQRLGGPD